MPASFLKAVIIVLAGAIYASCELPINGITLGTGWNELAGGIISIYAHRYSDDFALDAGTGLGATGVKVGTSARFFLTKWKLRPFTGIGIAAASGGTNGTVTVNDLVTKLETTPAGFCQLTFGFDLARTKGLLLYIDAGYNWRINNNLRILSGPNNSKFATDLLFGSGPVLGFHFGGKI